MNRLRRLRNVVGIPPATPPLFRRQFLGRVSEVRNIQIVFSGHWDVVLFHKPQDTVH